MSDKAKDKADRTPRIREPEDKDTYWRLDQIRMRGESVLRYVSLEDAANASTEALVTVLRMVAEELGERVSARAGMEASA